MSFEEHGSEELLGYKEKYAKAWLQSDCPTDEEIEELFVKALPPVTTDYQPQLQPLFDLFRETIDQNVIPLNRIMEITLSGFYSLAATLESDEPINVFKAKVEASKEQL